MNACHAAVAPEPDGDHPHAFRVGRLVYVHDAPAHAGAREDVGADRRPVEQLDLIPYRQRLFVEACRGHRGGRRFGPALMRGPVIWEHCAAAGASG